MPDSIFTNSKQGLMLKPPNKKAHKTQVIYLAYRKQRLSFTKTTHIGNATEIGRLNKPKLVDFTQIPKPALGITRVINTAYAVAHIEFNSINIALDAIYRFQTMPKQYYANWLQVANKEAKHFSLLSDFLVSLGYQHSSFNAHNGL